MDVQFFENLYTPDQEVVPDSVLHLINQKVDHAMNVQLCKTFSEEEISDALFQMGPLKAPGPDSFPARFFPETLGYFFSRICRRSAHHSIKKKKGYKETPDTTQHKQAQKTQRKHTRTKNDHTKQQHTTHSQTLSLTAPATLEQDPTAKD